MRVYFPVDRYFVVGNKYYIDMNGAQIRSHQTGVPVHLAVDNTRFQDSRFYNDVLSTNVKICSFCPPNKCVVQSTFDM